MSEQIKPLYYRDGHFDGAGHSWPCGCSQHIGENINYCSRHAHAPMSDETSDALAAKAEELWLRFELCERKEQEINLFTELLAQVERLTQDAEIVAKLKAKGYDLEVLTTAYGWTHDVDGNVAGLVAGDQCYEPSGIVFDAETIAAIKRDEQLADRAEKAEQDGAAKDARIVALEAVLRQIVARGDSAKFW